MTAPLVKALKNIQDETFGIAGEKIKIYQKKYKSKYDKKSKVKYFTFKVGAKVQYKKYFSKRAKGAKSKIQWFPSRGYYITKKL